MLVRTPVYELESGRLLGHYPAVWPTSLYPAHEYRVRLKPANDAPAYLTLRTRRVKRKPVLAVAESDVSLLNRVPRFEDYWPYYPY